MRKIKFIAFALVFALCSVGAVKAAEEPFVEAPERTRKGVDIVNEVYKAFADAYYVEQAEAEKTQDLKFNKNPDQEFPGKSFSTVSSNQILDIRAKIKELQGIYRGWLNKAPRFVDRFMGLGVQGNAKCLMCLYWLSQALCQLTIEAAKRNGLAFETSLPEVSGVQVKTETYLAAGTVQGDFSGFIAKSTAYIDVLNSIGIYLEAFRDLKNFDKVPTSKTTEDQEFSTFKNLLGFVKKVEIEEIGTSELFPDSCKYKFSLRDECKFGFDIDYLNQLLDREERLSNSLKDVFDDFRGQQQARLRKVIKSLNININGRQDFVTLPWKSKRDKDIERFNCPLQYPEQGVAIFNKYSDGDSKAYSHSSIAEKPDFKAINKDYADKVWGQVGVASDFKLSDDLYETKALLMKYLYFVYSYKCVDIEIQANKNLCNNLFALAKKYFDLAPSQITQSGEAQDSSKLWQQGLNLINAAESACLLYEVIAILKYLKATVDGNDVDTWNKLEESYAKLFSEDMGLKAFKKGFELSQGSAESALNLAETGQSMTLKNLEKEFYKSFMQVIVPLFKDLTIQRYYATHTTDVVWRQAERFGTPVVAPVKAGLRKLSETSWVKGLRQKVSSATQAVRDKYQHTKSSIKAFGQVFLGIGGSTDGGTGVEIEMAEVKQK